MFSAQSWIWGKIQWYRSFPIQPHTSFITAVGLNQVVTLLESDHLQRSDSFRNNNQPTKWGSALLSKLDSKCSGHFFPPPRVALHLCALMCSHLCLCLCCLIKAFLWDLTVPLKEQELPDGIRQAQHQQTFCVTERNSLLVRKSPSAIPATHSQSCLIIPAGTFDVLGGCWSEGRHFLLFYMIGYTLWIYILWKQG